MADDASASLYSGAKISRMSRSAVTPMPSATPFTTRFIASSIRDIVSRFMARMVPPMRAVCGMTL